MFRVEIETQKSTFWSVWYIIHSFPPSLTLCSWRTCNPDLQSNPIVVKSRKTLFSPVNTPPPMRLWRKNSERRKGNGAGGIIVDGLKAIDALFIVKKVDALEATDQ